MDIRRDALIASSGRSKSRNACTLATSSCWKVRASCSALPLIAALVAFLPWGLTGFRAQLGHGLPPGGDDLGPAALAETFIHLFTHNVSFAGSPAKWIFVAGAGLAAILWLLFVPVLSLPLPVGVLWIR